MQILKSYMLITAPREYNYYIFGPVRRLMFVGVNFLVKFNFFGNIHSVIMNRVNIPEDK